MRPPVHAFVQRVAELRAREAAWRAEWGEPRIGYVVEPSVAWRITLPAFYQPDGMQEVIIDPDRTGNMDVDYLIAQEVLHPSLTLDPSLLPLVRSQPHWSDQLMRWHTWDEGPAPWTLYKVVKAEP